MCEKCYEFSNSMAKRNFKHLQFGIPNGDLDICCVLVLKLVSIDKITTFYLIFETIFTSLYKESMFYSIEI